MLKPPEPFRYKTLATLEEGLGAELAASTAEACACWLDKSTSASEPRQATLPAKGAAPVWLIHIANTGVCCQPLSKWQVNSWLCHPMWGRSVTKQLKIPWLYVSDVQVVKQPGCEGPLSNVIMNTLRAGAISLFASAVHGSQPLFACLPGTADTLQELITLGGRRLLAIADHGNLPGNPGWLLRNSLLLAAVKFDVAELEVACIRLRRAKPCPQRSLLLSVALPASSEGLVACYRLPAVA